MWNELYLHSLPSCRNLLHSDCTHFLSLVQQQWQNTDIGKFDGSGNTHTPFNGPFSGTTQVSQYQKGKANLDFTEARDSEWQWHLLGHMQVCTSLQTDNHASTPPLIFLQAGCPSCRPTNSIKALKAWLMYCASPMPPTLELITCNETEYVQVSK